MKILKVKVKTPWENSYLQNKILHWHVTNEYLNWSRHQWEFLKQIATSVQSVKDVGSAFTHQKWIEIEKKKDKEENVIFYVNNLLLKV